MGRFQKPDSNFDSPLSNPQGWNLYSYVKGNPVNFNDPTGHEPRIRSFSVEMSPFIQETSIGTDVYGDNGAQGETDLHTLGAQVTPGAPTVTLYVNDQSGTLNNDEQKKQFEGEIHGIYGAAGINVNIQYGIAPELNNLSKQLIVTNTGSLPDQRSNPRMTTPKDAAGVTPNCGHKMFVDTKRLVSIMGGARRPVRHGYRQSWRTRAWSFSYMARR
jgi:hypothetical protein